MKQPIHSFLYERWREIAEAFGSELALQESGSSRRWTFRELAEAVEKLTSDPGLIAFPRGRQAEFVLELLRAWRDGRVVCPLEEGQSLSALGELPSGCVHLKSTSATTGKPRLVAFTGEQLAADAGNIAATMGLRCEWPNLGMISLAHSYGFSNLVLPLVLHGVPLILAEAPLPGMLQRIAGSFSELTLAAVPALWRAWHSARSILPQIRLAISAGAPLPIGLEEEIFNSSGLKVHNFYGSTECGGIAYDRTSTPRTDGTCIGSVMENVAVSVGTDGCLIVQGAAVGLTYWPDPLPHLGAGRFRTSDLGVVDDGNVYLCGRVSDVINVAGRKLMPESIEGLLEKHPAVQECVVVGVPTNHGERADLIVAWIVSCRPVEPEELKQYLLEQVPSWQVPRIWRFVETLRVNARGKISRSEWRERYIKEGV